MGFLLSLSFGFIPVFIFAWIIYWLDRYEKEPKLLLGAVFLWGAIVAAGLAFLVNTSLAVGIYLFTESDAATDLTTGTLIAPVVEEILKGMAVLVVFLVARHEFDSILDGIVYAGIVALGFAATENTLYIYRDGYLENGFAGLLSLAFVRIVLVGWQHPFYTAFIGIGLAITRLTRQPAVRLVALLAGLSLAIFLHSFHNLLANLFRSFGGFVMGTVVDWSGWIFMLLFILWAIYREQQLDRLPPAGRSIPGVADPDAVPDGLLGLGAKYRSLRFAVQRALPGHQPVLPVVCRAGLQKTAACRAGG